MSTIAAQGVLVSGRGTVARPVASRSVTGENRPQHPVPARMRLTRRGRGVLVLLAALLAFGIGSVADRAQASRPVEPTSYATIVVTPGESLWSIAAEIAGDRDVRDVVAHLREINELASSDLLVGQALLVPEAIA